MVALPAGCDPVECGALRAPGAVCVLAVACWISASLGVVLTKQATCPTSRTHCETQTALCTPSPPHTCPLAVVIGQTPCAELCSALSVFLSCCLSLCPPLSLTDTNKLPLFLSLLPLSLSISIPLSISLSLSLHFSGKEGVEGLPVRPDSEIKYCVSAH